MADVDSYAARLEIDYPRKMDRVTTFFRLLWAIPIFIIFAILSSGANSSSIDDTGRIIETSTGGITAALFFATLLMIVFRQKYPRWWFDFSVELSRFSARISSYVLLLTDTYPSTDEAQSVHLDFYYPDVKQDLNRWLPLVKWFLAIPHYIALLFLYVLVVFVTVFAWFAILFTGKYPRSLFDFVVGTMRWTVRVWIYGFLLTTDEYPPFSLR